MISLKKQLVLAAAAVLLTACGGGGGGGGGSGTDIKPASLTDASVQASIRSAVSASSQPFRWELAPTASELTVTVNGQPTAGLQVFVYRYTEETLDGGTVIKVPGDLVGSATTDADGKVKLELIADKTENVLVEVLDGPVKLEYQGKPYRIVNVAELGTLAFVTTP